jgi:hypothetical protein
MEKTKGVQTGVAVEYFVAAAFLGKIIPVIEMTLT